MTDPTTTHNELEDDREQYQVLIDSKSKLSNPEKLAYLWQALKDGEVMNVIEGLSWTGDDYLKAVKYLLEWYNQPYQIYNENVRAITEPPSLKDGK